MKRLLPILIVPVFMVVIWIVTMIDLAINGWLRTVPFSWTMIFTTEHAPAILWVNNRVWWVVMSLVFGLIGSLAVWLRTSRS